MSVLVSHILMLSLYLSQPVHFLHCLAMFGISLLKISLDLLFLVFECDQLL